MSALKITLPENCNEDESKVLQGKVTRSKKSDIEFNGKNVERVNTLFAQMLLAVHHECQQREGKMFIKNPSDELQQAFICIGAKEQLQEWKGEK